MLAIFDKFTILIHGSVVFYKVKMDLCHVK
jgi:hypothetical protein